MQKYLKYLPYLLIIVVFFIGRSTAPTHDKELIKKFQMDRKALLEDTARLNAINSVKDKEIQEIKERMSKDSLKFSIELRANKQAFLGLKKKYEQINLSRASAHELDSLVSSLYPENTN